MMPVVPVETAPNVIALDPYLFAFVKNNLATLSLVLGFFKGWAKISKNTTDDEISTLLSNLFASIKPGRKNNISEQPTKGETS